MGRISGRRRRSLPTPYVRVMVFLDTAGAGFEGLFRSGVRPGRRSIIPLKPSNVPPGHYTTRVNPVRQGSNGQEQPPANILRSLEKVILQRPTSSGIEPPPIYRRPSLVQIRPTLVLNKEAVLPATTT